MQSQLKGQQLVFKQEAFRVFYQEFVRIMSLTYKLVACFNIPALFIASLFFLRGLGLTTPSLFVVSTFLASHCALGSAVLTLPFSLFFKNPIHMSYFLYVPIFLYLFFSFWKLSQKQFKRPLLNGFLAALTATLIFTFINVGFGLVLGKYVSSYTPEYVNTIKNVSE